MGDISLVLRLLQGSGILESISVVCRGNNSKSPWGWETAGLPARLTFHRRRRLTRVFSETKRIICSFTHASLCEANVSFPPTRGLAVPAPPLREGRCAFLSAFLQFFFFSCVGERGLIRGLRGGHRECWRTEFLFHRTRLCVHSFHIFATGPPCQGHGHVLGIHLWEEAVPILRSAHVENERPTQ